MARLYCECCGKKLVDGHCPDRKDDGVGEFFNAIWFIATCIMIGAFWSQMQGCNSAVQSLTR